MASTSWITSVSRCPKSALALQWLIAGSHGTGGDWMDDIGLKDVLYDLLLRFIQYYDAKHSIPRPVSDPYITARQAAFRCLTAAIRCSWFLMCGLVCGCLLLFRARSEIESDTRIIFLCG